VIRRAIEADAEAIIAILEGMESERIYTAISRPWSADQQRRYLLSLSAREANYVAETEREAIIGYQTLECWSPTPTSVKSVRS
jgi:L-amino acid N-acyltransferase YncA